MSVCEHDPYCPGHGPHHDEAMMLATIRTKLGGQAEVEKKPDLNPLDGEPMLSDNADYVTQVREVRRNATKASRSGNPAKRGPAVRVLAQVPHLLSAVYRKDVSQRAVGVNQ